MKPCVKCGRDRKIGVFCEFCYLEDHPLAQTVKEISVMQCQKCKKIQQNNSFFEISLDAYIKKIIPQKISLNKELLEPIIYVGDISKTIDVTIRGKIGNNQLEEKYTVPLEIRSGICEDCRKTRPTYFEATVQIRTALDYSEIIKPFLEYVNKRVDHKTGSDYYFRDKKYAERLAKQLKLKLKGKITSTRRIFSADRQTSKAIYRSTYLFVR